MEQRCLLCNEDLTDEEREDAFVDAEWEVFGDYVLEEGGLEWPKGVHARVVCDDRFGWVHNRCQEPHGSGQTPEKRSRQFWSRVREMGSTKDARLF